MWLIVQMVHRSYVIPCLYVAAKLLIPSAQLIVAYCAGHKANTVRAEWRICRCYGTWYIYLPLCYRVLIKLQGMICGHEKLGLSVFTNHVRL